MAKVVQIGIDLKCSLRFSEIALDWWKWMVSSNRDSLIVEESTEHIWIFTRLFFIEPSCLSMRANVYHSINMLVGSSFCVLCSYNVSTFITLVRLSLFHSLSPKLLCMCMQVYFSWCTYLHMCIMYHSVHCWHVHDMYFVIMCYLCIIFTHVYKNTCVCDSLCDSKSLLSEPSKFVQLEPGQLSPERRCWSCWIWNWRFAALCNATTCWIYTTLKDVKLCTENVGWHVFHQCQSCNFPRLLTCRYLGKSICHLGLKSAGRMSNASQVPKGREADQFLGAPPIFTGGYHATTYCTGFNHESKKHSLV